jgi:hypothetical protein
MPDGHGMVGEQLQPEGCWAEMLSQLEAARIALRRVFEPPMNLLGGISGQER